MITGQVQFTFRFDGSQFAGRDNMTQEQLTLKPLMDWMKEKPYRRHVSTFADGQGSDVVLLLEWEEGANFPRIRGRGVGNNVLAAMLSACRNLDDPTAALDLPLYSVDQLPSLL